VTSLLVATATADADSSSSHNLDSATTADEVLDATLPVRIERFSVDRANLGRAKHADTAVMVRDTAVQMLLVDLIEELRDAGFADVAEFDAQESLADYYRVAGQFTELNPGSQSARVLWGFGAGKSRVCIDGSVEKANKDVAGTFRTCQKSLGWGDSSEQLEAEVDRIGLDLSNFLIDWSEQ